MKYEIAKKENIEQIYQLVQNTINAIYPLYYPQGVVEFFCGLHSKENIATDIENGFVRVLLSGDCLVEQAAAKKIIYQDYLLLLIFRKKDMAVILCNVLKKKYLLTARLFT